MEEQVANATNPGEIQECGLHERDHFTHHLALQGTLQSVPLAQQLVKFSNQSLKSSHLDISLLIHSDVAVIVNIPQLHVPCLAAELALVAVAAAHADVPGVCADVKTRSQEPLVTDNISVSGDDPDTSLDGSPTLDVTCFRLDHEILSLDSCHKNVSMLACEMTLVRLDHITT